MAVAKPSYWEMLKHPLWQQKRLKIMEYAGFQCENCGTNEVTLNVHHKYYTKNAKPWEYPDEALSCLCEPCHEKHHKFAERLKLALADLDHGDIAYVVGYTNGLALRAKARPEDSSRIKVSNYEEAIGLADSYHLSNNNRADQIIDSLDSSNSISHWEMNRLYWKENTEEWNRLFPDKSIDDYLTTLS